MQILAHPAQLLASLIAIIAEFSTQGGLHGIVMLGCGCLTALRVQQEQALADLYERSSLHALFYACAVDAGYEGECFLEACAKDGRAYLAQVPADEIFPLGERMPDGGFVNAPVTRVAPFATLKMKPSSL